MKTKLLFLTTVILLTPLVGGVPFVLVAQEPCPEQVFRDPATCPATLDLSQIVIDPNTNRPCLLGWVTTTVGRTWTWTARFCDPDGYPLSLSASAGTLTRNGDNYTVTGKALGAGIEYITMLGSHVMSAEQLAAGQEPVTRAGTFAVIKLPRKRPPSLCGGLP